MTGGRPLVRRVINELAAFPVVVAGMYVAGRLLFGGEHWL